MSDDSAVVHVPTEHTESYSAESSSTDADLDREELRQWDKVNGNEDDNAVGEGVGLAGGNGTFLSAMGQGNAMDVSRLGDIEGCWYGSLLFS
jgi:hypothetical protein